MRGRFCERALVCGVGEDKVFLLVCCFVWWINY